MKLCEYDNYFFCMLLFLSLSKVSVVFRISPSHANTNLPSKRFLHNVFVISKYSSILHALWQSQSHMLGFHMQSCFQ